MRRLSGWSAGVLLALTAFQGPVAACRGQEPKVALQAGCGQPAKSGPQVIARLIRKLGSEDGKEQEAAAAALKRLGTPALEPLRRAARSNPGSDEGRRARTLATMLTPHRGQLWCAYAGPWDRWFSAVSYGVESVAFSPDSRRVASAGGFHGDVKLWDVATGALVRRFPTGGRPVQRLVFSHDGRYLAAVELFDGDDIQKGSVIYLWETATGKQAHRLKGSPFEWSVAFSEDGKKMLSAGRQGVRWWDLKTGKMVKAFRLKRFPHFWGLSPDGRYVMGDKENRENFYAGSLIDLTTGKEIAHFPFGREGAATPNAVAHSPDGKAVLFSGKLRLRDARSGKVLVPFRGQREANDVAISPDGRRALSAHGRTIGKGFEVNLDCTVRLWDLKSGKELQRFRGHRTPVSAVAFSPDGRYAASGSAHGTLRV
jgi:sugar lactone lactonase YvrE